MPPTVKLLAAFALAALVSGASAQYPPAQPAPYAVPAYDCAPAAKPHRSWSLFGWLNRPAPLNAPTLKRAEYPLGFPQHPYVRSPRDYFMTEQ